VSAAAREAVRAAAVSGADTDARRAATTTGRLSPDRLRVDLVREPGESPLVRVHVEYVDRTEVPIAGTLVPDVVLSAEAVMRDER
jgi:hypothetical protein